MTEKVILEDGSEKEIPTDKELKDLQAGHDANKDKRSVVQEFKKVREDLGVKDGENLSDKIKQMQEEQNPNWQKARQKISLMEKALEEKGIKVKDDGAIATGTEFSKEEITKTTQNLIDEGFAREKKNEALSQFNSEERKSVEPLLDKMMLLGGTLQENVEIVSAKLFPDREVDSVKNAFNSANGNPPKQTASGDIDPEFASKFGVTEEDINKSK